MKDWEYYSTPKAAFFGYEAQKAYRDKIVAEIDNAPLTAADRRAAMDGVKKRVRDYITEMNKPYHAEMRQLQDEFWKDAQRELGYCEWLDNNGVSIIESKAWEQGHAGGLSEVYYHLCELCGFLTDIRGCFK